MDTRRRDDARSLGAADAEVEPTKPDEAIFSIEPLARQKRPASIVAVAAVALGIGGVAIVGVIGRQASPAPVAPAPVAEAPQPTTAVEPSPAAMTSLRFAEGPFGPLDGRTGVTPGRVGRALLTIDADQSDGMVFVHGDVFTRRAVNVVVVVTVADGRNRTITVKSVEIPGGSTAFRLGANDRFDASFDLPSSPTMQPTTVSASAYDDAGAVIATATTRLGQRTDFAIEAPASYR